LVTGGLRRELEERPVTLVGLDDEPVAVVVRGVRPDLVQVAADQEARVPAGRPEAQRQHRRHGRLAVAPRDGDRSSRRDERTKRF
jgi:hypothetical protein